MGNIKRYLHLLKPGIIGGNAMTAAAGFLLASRGHIDGALFVATLVGISLIIASGCASNNYIDRFADQKMARTKNRPLAQGSISSKKAIILAFFLGLTGTVILALGTNLLTTAVALLGFAVYVFFYSFFKYRSLHATLVGSIAGAVPPVVGYCAVTNRLDLGALLLFVILVLWQMPHFYAIAIFRLEEYAAASVPVLPLKKGIPAAKIQMLLYVVAFMISSLLLSFWGYVGLSYALTAAILGLVWLGLAMQGFKASNPKRWARQMFACSLVVITALCVVIPFSV